MIKHTFEINLHPLFLNEPGYSEALLRDAAAELAQHIRQHITIQDLPAEQALPLRRRFVIWTSSHDEAQALAKAELSGRRAAITQIMDRLEMGAKVMEKHTGQANGLRAFIKVLEAELRGLGDA